MSDGMKGVGRMSIAPMRRGRQGFAGLFDYTLFVGPSACFHHSLDVMPDLSRTSALCLDDTQIALGSGGRLIAQAAEELIGTVQPSIESLRILTSCQSAFVGVDYRAVARDVARRHGIVCVHQENNRMTVASRHDKGIVSGTGDPRAFARGLLDCAELAAGAEDAQDAWMDPQGERRGVLQERPFARSANTQAEEGGGAPCRAGDGGAGGRGFAFLSEGLDLDPRCELWGAARDWGFDWTSPLREWGRAEGLARAPRTGFALACDTDCEAIAREAQRRWDADWLRLPVSYSLDEIDAAYAQLDARFGARADVAAARHEAQRAVERALAAAGGRALDLDLAGTGRPWHLAKALLDYGFSLGRIGCSFADRTHPVTHDADYEELLASHPQAEAIIAEEEFIHRKSKLACSEAVSAGPGAAGAGVGAGAADADAPADEGACWGYFALTQCMRNLQREVERA